MCFRRIEDRWWGVSEIAWITIEDQSSRVEAQLVLQYHLLMIAFDPPKSTVHIYRS